LFLYLVIRAGIFSPNFIVGLVLISTVTSQQWAYPFFVISGRANMKRLLCSVVIVFLPALGMADNHKKADEYVYCDGIKRPKGWTCSGQR